MIELRMAAGDLSRLRFGYSPLVEVIDSLNVLHSPTVHPLHRAWASDTRKRLRGLDTMLLQAIAPPGRIGLTPPLRPGAGASVRDQLRLVADWPPDRLAADLEAVWRGQPMPAAAREVIRGGPAGARRVAAALATYWDAAIAPHWDQMRGVLEADIAYRARQAALGGIGAAVNDLHPQLRLHQSAIQLRKPASRTYQVTGKGALLMPSIFGGLNLPCDLDNPDVPLIVYSPRGLALAWQKSTAVSSEDPLAALIGTTRTAILHRTASPATTTSLATQLRLSSATISVHLSTLKRCGMLTSWRSGRCVLYQRTDLADSILTAAASPAADP